jgi:hypothetical protein
VCDTEEHAAGIAVPAVGLSPGDAIRARDGHIRTVLQGLMQAGSMLQRRSCHHQVHDNVHASQPDSRCLAHK